MAAAKVQTDPNKIYYTPSGLPYGNSAKVLEPTVNQDVQAAQFNPGNYGAAGVNSISLNTNYSQPAGVTAAQPVPRPLPPTAPNLKPLQQKFSQVNNKAAINQAMKEYDALTASTQAAGSQAAQNAGNVYANRLMQQGINPVASGVVAAQAKLPVYGQLAQIGVQKEQTRLDFTNKADALASQIATSMANLQLGYAQTLADFNKSMYGYDLDLNKFNANQLSRAGEFQQSYGLEAAKFEEQKRAALVAEAARGGAGGGSAASRSGAGAGERYQGYMGMEYTPAGLPSGQVTPSAAYGNFLNRTNQTWGYNGY